MCATKRKITSIAKTNSELCPDVRLCPGVDHRLEQAGPLRLLSGPARDGHSYSSELSSLSSLALARVRRRSSRFRFCFGLCLGCGRSLRGGSLVFVVVVVRGYAASRRFGDFFTLRSSVSVTLPPAASIFAVRSPRTRSASTVSATLSSPSPRIFTGSGRDLTMPASRRLVRRHARARATACSARLTLIGSYSTRNRLLKPRLRERARTSGIWPPSKPMRRSGPLRDFWPLMPRPE